eukprot:jgi/Galph1/5808/GphlegSOOS_G4529.1
MWNFTFVVATLMTSCSVNMLTLEFLLNLESFVGDFITFLQATFVVLFSIGKWLKRRRQISFLSAIVCSILFYGSNRLNTVSLQYGLPVPIYIVFRSSSLLITFLCSVLFQRKKVCMMETFAILLTSVGLTLVAWISNDGTRMAKSSLCMTRYMKGFFFALIGSFLSPLLSILQEEILETKQNKKEASEELLCLMQLFSLLYYIPQSKALLSFGTKCLSLASSSPVLYLIILNLTTQMVCIQSVFNLSAKVNAVALQMTLSVRKLLSLLLSCYIFQHHLSKRYWLGSLMVFIGSLLYSLNTVGKRKTAQI